jgi:hypothetical protein
MRNPPILISVIGSSRRSPASGICFFGLRVLGFDWFGILGDLPKFDSVGLWGWLAIFAGIAWLLAAFGLWALQPWARVVALVVAGFSLFEARPGVHPVPGDGHRLRAWPCCPASSCCTSPAARSRPPSARTEPTKPVV